MTWPSPVAGSKTAGAFISSSTTAATTTPRSRPAALFFLEWDDRPVPWQLSAWQRYGLGEPTISITTGGKSAHLYWVLNEPIATAEWIPIQAALIEITGADSSIRNPSRVMRLPGGSYIGAAGTALGMTTIYSASGLRYSI